MANLNKIMQILLLTAIVMIIHSLKRREPRGSYTAVSFLSISIILSNYDLFTTCTRFQPHIWLEHLYRPIMYDLNAGRDYYLFDGVHQRHRRKALSKYLRLVRFCMRYSGFRTSVLILIFGQSKQTINKDCEFIAQIIIKTHYANYIHLAIPGTREYNEWVGAGVFREHFPTTIYALDIMKIKIRKPRVNQRDYFDGHHHEHNIGVGVMCNGYGQPCLCSAPFAGRIPDGTIWHQILGYANLDVLVLNGHFIVADRIFRFEPPPILTAYTGYDNFTMQQLLFNYFQASCRIIIENLFGRFKVIFPIFFHWTYPMEWLDLYIQCGFVMLAMILKHQAPLRTY